MSHPKSNPIDWPSLHLRLEKAQAALERGYVYSPEARQAILKARAQALAQEPQAGTGQVVHLEVVEFLLAHETYGIESTWVREVYPLKDLTPMPGAPPHVLGIVNIRGQIVSVIELKKFFGLPDKGLTDLNRVVVLRGGNIEFGILADAIVGTRRIALGELQAALPALSGLGGDFYKGLTPAGTIILDAGKLLADESIIVHEEV